MLVCLPISALQPLLGRQRTASMPTLTLPKVILCQHNIYNNYAHVHKLIHSIEQSCYDVNTHKFSLKLPSPTYATYTIIYGPLSLSAAASYIQFVFLFLFASAYLSCDGSMESRQLFLSISNSDSTSQLPTTSLHHVPNCNTDNNMSDTATISIVVQPVPDSVLVQVTKTKAATTTGALAFDYTRHDSLEAEIELRKSEPLPFSSKRSMFSTGKVAQVMCIHCMIIMYSIILESCVSLCMYLSAAYCSKVVNHLSIDTILERGSFFCNFAHIRSY